MFIFTEEIMKILFCSRNLPGIILKAAYCFAKRASDQRCKLFKGFSVQT